MKDEELQLALARMLPEKLYVLDSIHGYQFASWSPGGRIPVQDTEWCHICWLVRSKYELPILVGSNEPWQEQARHILRHVKAREAMFGGA